jgi:DNA polymerase-3 subunit beta
MNIEVNTDSLRKVLNKLVPIAKGKQTLPILSFIKIEAKDDTLDFTTTNLEEWVEKRIPATVNESGTLCINTSILNDFIAALHVETIKLSSDGDNLIVKAENVEAIINGIDVNDFPTMPRDDEQTNLLTIESTILTHGISQVIGAVSDDLSRLIITGVYLHNSNGGLYLVATDTHRLARQYLMEFNHEEAVKLLITSKTMQFLPRLFEDEKTIAISFTDSLVIFKSEHTSLISRLIEGAYPNYEALLPTSFKTQINVDKASLENALSAATIFSKTIADSAILIFSENDQLLTVEGKSNDGVGQAKLSTEIRMEGSPISIKLNGRYALDALGHVEKNEIKIGLNDELSPILFTSDFDSDFFRYIVMPLKKD